MSVTSWMVNLLWFHVAALATFYVVLHHGLGSSVGSGHLVFRDPDHIAHPWKWAGIHAAFVAAAGLASILSWRLNERVREGQAEALEAARESEERYRSSFDDAVIGMCLSTPDGRLSRVNPAFCHMLGRSREELEGMTWAQITAPEDLRDSRALLEGMLNGGDDRGHGEKRSRTSAPRRRLPTRSRTRRCTTR